MSILRQKVNAWAHQMAATVQTTLLAKEDERGLSQSTENAILLAGAVAVAGIIITVITAYVRANLPS